MEQNILVGKPKKGDRVLRELTAGDPWADAQFYAVGEANSEHVKAWPVGGVICGIFRGLRVSNKNGPESKQRDYAVFDLEDGGKIRVFTPGQLHYNLSNIPTGTYVEMTYLGKEMIARLETEVHKFKVLADLQTQ